MAQEALIELVSATRCYGTSAAREMDIYRIIPSCALHVRGCVYNFSSLYIAGTYVCLFAECFTQCSLCWGD